jgi:uncharacterized RDD family membrane protein YckC
MSQPFGATDPTAVVGRRLLAALIDFAIGAAIGTALFMALADSYDTLGFVGCDDVAQPNFCVSSGSEMTVVEGGPAWLMIAAWLAWSTGIYVVMRGLTGKTPGTAALGVAVVDEHGRPPGIGKALVRSLAGIVDYIPCCVPLVGVITVAATKSHQRVGDLAARTYCVDKRAVGLPVTGSPAPGAPVGAYGVAATPPAPAGQPQWDPQRNAYIQWDQASGRWLQFDQTTNQWTPIQGG